MKQTNLLNITDFAKHRDMSRAMVYYLYRNNLIVGAEAYKESRVVIRIPADAKILKRKVGRPKAGI